MINGKFFTGLPPKMIDRTSGGGGQNRQQTHFFWPDDTDNESAIECRVKRRNSVQAENRDVYVPRGEPSSSDAENKERFKKEFTRSSIQFCDNVEQTPLRRSRQKIVDAPAPKLQNLEPPVNTSGKRKEAFHSRIEFYDYAEDLNNVPRTDKNNKAEVERNTKNSPKLQNKQLSFDQPEDAINFIENDVRNMKVTAPPRRRNTVRDNRPRYTRAPPRDDPYSDFNEDYVPSRRQPLSTPTRTRYSESDPDFEEHPPRRQFVNNRPAYYDSDAPDYIFDHPTPPARRNFDHGMSSTTGRQVHFTYSGSRHDSMADALSYDHNPVAPQQVTRKVNILKVDNDIKNNGHRVPPSFAGTGTAGGPSPPSQKHLRSNICFSDSESATPPCPPKRNIRSSAVNRVSVGLPD